jgi:hypothetical protein
MELTDVYRIFHSETSQYMFFSAGHGTFSKIDHILRHKESFNKYVIIEINPYILSDHNKIKLELNNKSSSRKYSSNWRLNITLLNNQQVTEEIREKIKKFLEYNGYENTTYQNLWDTAKAVLREKFTAISAYIKNIARSQINHLILYLKIPEKQEQAKPKTSRRREIIKGQNNKIETKNPYEESKKKKLVL